MPIPDLSYNITLLSFFMSLIIAFFFLITKKGRKSGNSTIAILLILFSLQIFYSYTVSNSGYIYFMNWHKSLFLLRQTAMLTGPLIFFYALSFSKNLEFKPIQLLHVLPFIGILIYLTLHFINLKKFVIWQSPLGLYTTVLILLSNLTYIFLAFVNLKMLNFSFSEWKKNMRKSSYMSWIQYILIGFIIVWILNLNITAIYMITQKPLWCAYSRSIYTLAVFVFLGTIVFILMLKPAIYSLPEISGKYKKSTINDDVKIKHKQVLINYMEFMKPYLNPDITLETVASETSINSRILSQIINESYNNNFNGYINEFRIKESLAQLSDSKNKKTILEILYDSGFNSKSAFYTEFKKHTGITPLEYRNQNKVNQKILVN